MKKRFLLKVIVNYPNRDEEREILNLMGTTTSNIKTTKVISKQDISKSREAIDLIHVEETIKDYIVSLVVSTRNPETNSNLNQMIRCGASPRATINLILASKAIAFMNGRSYVIPNDVKKVVPNRINKNRNALTSKA